MISQKGSPWARLDSARLAPAATQGAAMRAKRGEAGQTLLEILFAFSAVILIMGAVIAAVIVSLSNAQYAKNQNLATSFTQEGLAVVRNIRDSNWANFSALLETTYCLGQNSMVLEELISPTCSDQLGPSRRLGKGGIFSREVIFDHESEDCCSDNTVPCAGIRGSKATVKVSWTDNKCSGTPYCHKVEVISCFSKID
jgi:hypothetical protein